MLVDLPCGADAIAARLHAHVSQNATFRVYLLRSKVRSMSAAFRMYLLHVDNDLRCIGSACSRSVAPFGMHLLHLNSVPDEPAHRSPREEHMRMTMKPSSFESEIGKRVV